jgi:hypothetical protein
MAGGVGKSKISYDKAVAVIQEARICLLAGARIKDSADPTDALLVLLSGPLSELHGQIFKPLALSQKVQRHFGWNLSPDAIEFFIPKFRSLGWLQSGAALPARGPLYVNLPEPGTDGTSGADTKEALERLGADFQAFAKELSPFQALPEDPAEAGAALLRHVVDANLPVSVPDARARSDEAFLAARFAQEVNAHKLPARDTLASLSAVGFLMRVADEIAQPSTRRAVELRIVVDGPILLDYLGCSGPLRAESSREIFERLRKIGAATITFEHCVREARVALASVLKANPRDRYGPTGEALRKGWVNENAMLGLLQGFEVVVRKSDIAILPSDRDFSPNLEKFFNDELADGVEAIVNWHDSDNKEARYADADTTVMTLRKRAGYRTNDLFSSQFVCVTTNEMFAAATKRHLSEIHYYNSKQVPPVITMKELAAKLWLEVGNSDKDARLTLPNSQMLLSCERALRLNREVVDKARAELEKVRPEQVAQFELLLEVPRSARAVMDIALNNERYVTGNTIDQLLEAAVEAAGSEVAAKARAQRAKDHEKFQHDLTAAAKQIEAERERAEQLEEQARAGLERWTTTEKGMLERIGERATARFRFVRATVRSLSVFVAIAPLITVLILAWTGAAGMVAAGIAAVPALLGAAAAMDRPGAWLSRLIQRWIEHVNEGRLRKVGHYDLADNLKLTWSDGVAVAERDDTASPTLGSAPY